MYRDRAQWTKVRRRLLVDQIPIRQVVRETGISRKTIRKMLANRWPKEYGPRSPGTSEPPPQTASIGRTKRTATNSDSRPDSKTLAFDWMRSVLQNQIALSTLRHQVGDPPELGELRRRLYDGRLTDRNRSMVILANRHGLSSSVTCSFLGISRHAYRSYLRTFEHAGESGLFARQTRSNRKFDNEAIKNAVFGLLHEPPSSYSINRTTWTMGHLSQILRETGRPVSPSVISKIIKLAGYRWRKARIVLTSNDPAFSEKLDRVRSILADLRPDEAFFSIDEFGPDVRRPHKLLLCVCELAHTTRCRSVLSFSDIRRPRRCQDDRQGWTAQVHHHTQRRVCVAARGARATGSAAGGRVPEPFRAERI